MKAKFLLAATLVLASAVGTVNANPTEFKGNKAETAKSFNKENKLNNQVKKHHRHHRKHHRRHVIVKH